MKKQRVIAILVGIAAIGNVRAGELELTFRTDKDRYRLGDQISFMVTFRNVSQRTLRILPNAEQYDTRTICLISREGHRAPKALQLVELSTYFDSWAKDMITLKPKQVSTWMIMAQFRDRLPPDWKDNRPGVYLVFYGGTAFSLPGFGKYSAFANYTFSRDHRVMDYVPTAGPPIWFGSIKSPVIAVEFEKGVAEH